MWLDASLAGTPPAARRFCNIHWWGIGQGIIKTLFTLTPQITMSCTI